MNEDITLLSDYKKKRKEMCTTHKKYAPFASLVIYI